MIESNIANPGKPVITGGLPVARLTSSELVQIMVRDCLAARNNDQVPRLIFSANGHSISLAGRNPEFRKVMRTADIIHPDGMSVVFASRLFSGNPLPERIATTDFFHLAAKSGETSGLRFYFLGGREEVNEKAYTRAKNLYPEIRWVGRHHGFFEEHEEDKLCEIIRAARPDVLWVGLGRPQQEIFSVRNREQLTGIGWIKTCGGLFDFLAGNISRAPDWMQRTGLEWVWRIFQEPGRLFWRYFFTNIHALWCLVFYSRADE